MENRKPVYLESDTIEITEKEVDFTRNIVKDFKELLPTYRNFYVTVFENHENRKVILKFSGGELRSGKIEKIDEGEE